MILTLTQFRKKRMSSSISSKHLTRKEENSRISSYIIALTMAKAIILTTSQTTTTKEPCILKEMLGGYLTMSQWSLKTNGERNVLLNMPLKE